VNQVKVRGNCRAFVEHVIAHQKARMNRGDREKASGGLDHTPGPSATVKNEAIVTRRECAATMDADKTV
jgi:hypothetical protein